ncbi:MAG: hypothetical protein R2827_03765 [Bdellovibrionales bacterium]
MKFILVLEPSKQIFEDLKAALLEIDGKFKLKRFLSTAEISAWLKKVIDETFTEEEMEQEFGTEEMPTDIDIPMIVLNTLGIGKMQTTTLEKLQGLLIQHELCDPDNPCGFVLLGTVPIPPDYRKYLHPCVRNFLTTPFDPLTLKEFFRIAIKGNQKIQTELYTEKSDFTIEMIKEVNITRITELGFRTSSTREIPTGRKAKYYNDHFGSGKNRAIFAYCYANNPVGEEEFSCSFGYFGISKQHLLEIRGAIANSKNSEVLAFYNEPKTKNAKMQYLTNSEGNFNRLKEIITGKFKDIEVSQISKFEDYKEKPEGADYYILIVDNTMIESGRTKERFKLSGKNPFIGFTSALPIETFDDLERNATFDDVLYLPVDDFYLARTLKQNIPESYAVNPKTDLSGEVHNSQ